jgi:hypothetical protein
MQTTLFAIVIHPHVCVSRTRFHQPLYLAERDALVLGSDPVCAMRIRVAGLTQLRLVVDAPDCRCLSVAQIAHVVR